MAKRDITRRDLVTQALVLFAALAVGTAGCTATTEPTTPSVPGGASADAVTAEGSYVVVDTGQTDSYGLAGGRETAVIAETSPGDPLYGQDAVYTGAQPSYRDNEDGTVTDLNAGLVWQQDPSEPMTWEESFEYAESLELGGASDWRVPTIKELYSLMLFYGDINTETPYLDTSVFGFEYPDTSTGARLIDAQYWSSTAYVGTTMNDDQSAFGVNFADGRIKGYPTLVGPGGQPKANYVRCVRGGDGYGVNDFVDNGDGTVTDRATGLMWSTADSGEAMDWEGALAWAEGLDTGGHNDWRLPNAKELQSIVDYSRAPNATDPSARSAAIDPVFELTETESWFWTGTTHLDNGGAVYVCFGRALAYDQRTGEFTIDAHGAGAQRSDPKAGDASQWPEGLGPQGDQIRILNHARAVRDSD